MSGVLGEFTTKVVNIKAVRVTELNLYEVAELCEGVVGFETVKGTPRLFLTMKTLMGDQKVFTGMWLVQYADGHWMSLRDDNFRRKFVPVKPKIVVEIFPPYDR